MMHLIEKYAQAAASTARLPLNSPARRAADEKEMALRAEVKKGVADQEAERDELRARLAELARQEPVAWSTESYLGFRTTGEKACGMFVGCTTPLYARPVTAIPDGWKLVNAGALAMVVNALRRDAEEGRPVRGEMADELIAAAPEHKA